MPDPTTAVLSDLTVAKGDYNRWRWERVTADGRVLSHGEWHTPASGSQRDIRAAATAAMRDLMVEARRHSKDLGFT